MPAHTTRPPRRGAALAVLALTLTGCSVGVPLGGQEEEPVAEADTSDLTQGPVPDHPAAVAEEDLPGTLPAEDAPRTESIARTALREVTSAARVVDPDAEAECVDEGENGQFAFDCTVTYEGVDADYFYAERPDGSVLENLLTIPVLRSVVEDDLRIEEDTEYVGCAMDDVEVAAGELAMSIPPYKCEYLDTETQEIEPVEADVDPDGTVAFYSR